MRSILTVLLCVTGIYTPANSLPNLSSVTGGFTHQQELVLGRSWLRTFRRSADQISDPLILDYLSNQIQYLKQKTDLTREPVSFVVINSSQLNAFAVPGKIMGINSGLFLKAQNEEQFMSVVAHELSHLELKHFNQLVTNYRKQKKVEFLSLLSAVLVAKYSTEASQAIFVSGLANTRVQGLEYSRTLETEADRRAASIMLDAGYSTDAISNMLETLMTQSLNSGDYVPEYFRTHPLSESRVADSLKIGQTKSVGQTDKLKKNSFDFEMIRLSLSRHHKFPVHPQNEKSDNQLRQSAERLMLFDNKLESGDVAAAINILASFPERYYQEIEYVLRKSRLLNRTGHTDDAIAYIELQRSMAPNSIRLTLELSDILKAEGQTEKSIQIIRELATYYKSMPSLWFKVLQISDVTTEKWIKFDAEIHYKWLMGQEDAVINQLQNNLYSDNWSGVEKSRINDRLETYQRELNLLSTPLN